MGTRKNENGYRVSRNSREENSDANGRSRGGGMGVRTILFTLMSAVFGFLVSKYGTGNEGKVARRKAVETVQTLRKLISSRVGSSDVKGELWSADGTTKSFYLLPNGENDGGKNVTITIGEDLSELERRLSVEIVCGPIVPLEILPADTPCRIYDGAGHHINDTSSSSSILFKSSPLQSKLHRLYMIPPDRHFMWPTVEVGHVVEIPPTVATGPQGLPRLITLSTSPKVYLLEKFFSEEEGEQIVQSAKDETEAAFKLKRSEVGTKGNLNSLYRTSYNAFISNTDISVRIQKRIFSFLGLGKYEPTWADGLQVLRYNPSEAYSEHLDYLDSEDGHDFDTAKQGTNRFATVILYFNDVESGGETCFALSSEVPAGLPSDDEVLKSLREGDMKESGIKRDSWEEKLAVTCRTHLAVKPEQGRAVLFYDQLPNGEVDEASLHGACPVLKGQKWAANLWVWNGPRYGLSSKDQYGRVIPNSNSEPLKVSIKFMNEDVNSAALYYQTDKSGKETFWSGLVIGNDIKISSYVGHTWLAKVNGKTVRSWDINSQQDTEFVLKTEDLFN
eukprot:313583_1